MKDFIDEKFLETIGADIIITDNNVEADIERTYVGYLDSSRNIPVIDIENSNVWRIKLIERIGDFTRILWPNGSRSFEFNIKDVKTYNYRYKI